jgi:hypothetical protein
MLGDVEVNKTASVVGQDEEEIKHAKSRGGHGEEVDGGQRSDVVVEEVAPRLRRRFSRSRRHQARDLFRRDFPGGAVANEKCKMSSFAAVSTTPTYVPKLSLHPGRSRPLRPWVPALHAIVMAPFRAIVSSPQREDVPFDSPMHLDTGRPRTERLDRWPTRQSPRAMSSDPRGAWCPVGRPRLQEQPDELVLLCAVAPPVGSAMPPAPE